MPGDEGIRERVKKQFGRNAKKYVESENHSRQEDLDKVVEWLSPEPSWVCLDIATGGGHVAKAVSRHVDTVVASDLTLQMLEESRKDHLKSGINNVIYVLADAENLPFPGASFDAVTCRIAPHHFSEKGKFVSEAFRILKDGGKFLLIDNVSPKDSELSQFMNKFEWMRDNSHVECISLEGWKKMLAESGFRISRSETRRKELAFVTWAGRTAESEEQVSRVANYLLSASTAAFEYFKIVTDGNSVKSFEIDEGGILAVKPGSNAGK